MDTSFAVAVHAEGITVAHTVGVALLDVGALCYQRKEIHVKIVQYALYFTILLI